MYDQMALSRNDTPVLRDCIEKTVDHLLGQSTSTQRPGMLLGKIQSGKTNAFLGVIALAFDKKFDIAIILTKGTVSLARQTLKRVQKDFQYFIEKDEVQVFDIMSIPSLTPYELNQKLILVVKKEDDNLKRLLTAFSETYPTLKSRKILIIDDEADFASLSYRKQKGKPTGVGVIAGQIDTLRGIVNSSAVLQVTATPYSLYLQPEFEAIIGGVALFKPKRPAFTVVLPVHDAYVGGDYYFEKSDDIDSPAYYFYESVPDDEREILKKEDRRRFKIENSLIDKQVAMLRKALAIFILGGVIRRMQQVADGVTPEKYSFLFHTEQSRSSHSWQERIVVALNHEFVAALDKDILRNIFQEAYQDLCHSLAKGGKPIPDFEIVYVQVKTSLVAGELMVTKVNSDKQVDELLDNEGQLRLRTPLNLFIGGQILDRGITIRNLIGFYYGRNPKKFQQDTVLQHSRMYGARHKDDLPVTRFYAPVHVYQVMKKIHEFDAALREAFESGAHEQGVYFILRDAAKRIAPCSPNKLLFSKLTSVRAGGRLLPVGFQTIAKTNGKKNLHELDTRIRTLLNGSLDGHCFIDVERAIELLELAHSNFDWPDDSDETKRSQPALIEHLSRTAVPESVKGQVLLLAASDRDIVRIREEGRPSDAPDTKQQRIQAQQLGGGAPALVMLREVGSENQGWRGLEFWWPVVVAPANAPTAVFADQQPQEDGGVSELPTN